MNVTLVWTDIKIKILIDWLIDWLGMQHFVLNASIFRSWLIWSCQGPYSWRQDRLPSSFHSAVKNTAPGLAFVQKGWEYVLSCRSCSVQTSQHCFCVVCSIVVIQFVCFGISLLYLPFFTRAIPKGLTFGLCLYVLRWCMCMFCIVFNLCEIWTSDYKPSINK